jgi:hypothetical protein
VQLEVFETWFIVTEIINEYLNGREEFKSFQSRFICPIFLIHKFDARLTLRV